jgi:hypothetical protein
MDWVNRELNQHSTPHKTVNTKSDNRLANSDNVQNAAGPTGGKIKRPRACTRAGISAQIKP